MIIGINQPYLFPYIGYWQLISAVDKFIILDDVSFIKQGYINRNYIFLDEKPKLFTLQTIGAGSNTMIHNVEVGCNSKKIVKMIRHAYLNSPQFDKVFPLVEHILMNSEKNLATYVGNSIQEVLDYLNISTKISYSSTIKNNQLSGQDRILDICKRQAADKYINPVGGRDLYSKEQFTKNGIELSFLKRKIVEYNQGEAEFYKDLSIIDILMYNDKSRISSILKEFELL